eukprot:TRINITY_DN790_c0_g1_i2.p1 TRINITY_DN790_c0_g1~~TRINITY_DN790_c0_g1_i2.p1  ORF type:complete len:146 (+),score=27.93 TRINITY_DN790_c0_g1_i2:55-492(+)
MAELVVPKEMPKEYGGIPVDPRVEWAMKVMDYEDHDYQKFHERLLIPVGFGFLPVFFNFYMTKDPTSYKLSAKLKKFFKQPSPMMLLGVPLFMGFGAWCEDYRYKVNQDNRALMRHYILTHPERFPEPRRHKFADSILPWFPRRP